MDRSSGMPAAIVGACALVIVLGFAFALTAPSAPPVKAPAPVPGSTPSTAAPEDAGDSSSMEPTYTLVTRGAGALFDDRASTGPRDSFAAILDPVSSPVVATDVAGILLARPGVQKAVTRYLRVANRPKAEDVGIAIFPAQDMAASVFVPYGAVAVRSDKNRFRLYGAVCRADVVVTWAAVPLLSGASATPVWLDIQAGGAHPKVVALHDIGEEWFYHSLGEDSAKIRAVPEWIMHRFPVVDDAEDGTTLVDVSADPTLARLVLTWLLPRVPKGASAELPPGYSAAPHDHPGISEHRQLSPAQLRLIFKPDKDAGQGTGEWVDFSGPDPQEGPVRLFQVIGNDPSDYSGILNESTHKGLRSPDRQGWFEFRDAIWTGDILTVDILLDEDLGAIPTILHCEIDWKTMTVLRAVPYGPLSPF